MLAWFALFVNAFFALTLVEVETGTAILNMVVVIFLALHIYFKQDPKEDENEPP